MITLKCLEKDPQRRYSSAASLADDLERYLRGEPIQARRTDPLERAAKWVRRKPALAGLIAAGAAAVLASVGLSVAVPLYMQTQEAWRVAERERAKASGAADRAGRYEYLFRIVLAESYRRDSKIFPARETLIECEPARRNWEWYYLDRVLNSTSDLAKMQESRTLGRLEGPVCALAFLPDGSLMAAGGAGSMRLWERPMGPASRSLLLCEQPLGHVVVSADGRRLAASLEARNASGSECVEFRVWSIPDGHELLRRTASEGPITGLALSRDGSRLAISIGVPSGASPGSELRTYDVGSMAELCAIARPYPMSRVVLSHDGELVAAATEDAPNAWVVKAWDTRTRREVFSYTMESNPGLLAFSPDAGQMLIGQRTNISIVDVATSRFMTMLLGHGATVRDLAFSPDSSRLATASDDGTIRLWDWHNIRRTTPLPNHNMVWITERCRNSASRTARIQPVQTPEAARNLRYFCNAQ